LEQGPLAGGLCKPFFSPLFDVFVSKTIDEPRTAKTDSCFCDLGSVTSNKCLFYKKPVCTTKFDCECRFPFANSSPTLTPTKEQTTEKITSSEITVEACRIKVKTTKREIFLNTNFLEFNPQTKCYQFVLNRVSPSGKYVVYQDISGGIDSMLRVYSLEHNDTIQLDVFGTSDIFDISFLPDDKLIALYGYKGISKEQYLKVFDLSGLFAAYPSNIDKQYKYFTDLTQYSKNITLPDIGKDYFSLSVSSDKINIYGTGGVNAGTLKEYTFDELLK